jgi:predicted esterase
MEFNRFIIKIFVKELFVIFSSVMAGPIVIPSLAAHKSTMVFMHGLGDVGSSFVPLFKSLQHSLPHCKFILPTAPVAPVTLNGGMRMTRWYDIHSLHSLHPTNSHGDEGVKTQLESSMKVVVGLVGDDARSGKRIGIGGFSQGGALTLYTLMRALTDDPSLIKQWICAVVLSAYLPLASSFKESATTVGPVVWMAHGKEDEVIPVQHGRDSVAALKKMGVRVEWDEYERTGHSLADAEITKLAAFLKRHLEE